MLHSSMKTMLHEIGHMFGMKHCTWYNCLMRGSNGAEVEHQPNYLHLCPVCLHKLQWSTGCNIPNNYAQLFELLQPFEEASEAFKVDCDFLRKRLCALEDVPIPDIPDECQRTSSRISGPTRQRSKNASRVPRPKSLPRASSIPALKKATLSADGRSANATNEPHCNSTMVAPAPRSNSSTPRLKPSRNDVGQASKPLRQVGLTVERQEVRSR